MPALQMAGMRQMFGGLCYVIFFIAKGAALPKGKEWRSVLILCLLNFLLSNTLSTWGVKYISAGLGSIIGSIFPLWIVVIGLFGGTVSSLNKKSIIGLLVGFTGICIIFAQHLSDFVNPAFQFGIFLSLIATWTWAFGTIYTKKHAAQFNPYFSLGLQMFISGITLITATKGLSVLPVANIHVGTSPEKYFIPLATIPWQSWAAMAYLTVFGSVISFIAYLYALQKLPTEQVSVYAYINPVVAVVAGFIIFGEMLTPYIIVGVLITLYGVYLVNKSVGKLR